MDFKKDLLLIDLESTGLDVDKHEIIQIAAVLLDRKTLKEKKFFNSYIKPTKWQTRDLESMKVNGLTWEVLKNGAIMKEVLKNFSKFCDPKKVILSSYVSFADKNFLLHAYKKHKVQWKFDYHVFDLWGFFYAKLAFKNKLKNGKDFAGFGLESLLKDLKIKIPGKHHDALYDCRLEAEVLRRLIK